MKMLSVCGWGIETAVNSGEKTVELMVLYPHTTTKEIAESVGISLAGVQDHINS